MKTTIIAFVLLLTLTVPAQAEPITLGIAAINAFGAWYATIGFAGQLLVNIGVSLALSAASYGLSYLIGGAGKRQTQAQQGTAGTSIPEYASLLEVRRAYGVVTTAGGVFSL